MQIPIDDPDDRRLAPYRLCRRPTQLARDGLFIAESRRVVRTLIEASPFTPLSVLATPTAYEALADAWNRLDPAVPIYIVGRELARGLVGFDVHRGCLAVARRAPAAQGAMEAPDTPVQTATQRLEALLEAAAPGAPLLILEAITDPDNVGSIFRSARGFGAAGVILAPGCASPLYRKAIRTSLGATLVVPFAEVTDWPAPLLQRLDATGIRSVALTPAAAAHPLATCADTLAREPVALIVGTEGDGLSADCLARSSAQACIPMRPGADSLNAAVATAVALYRFSEAAASSTAA